jgi:hypothetical protein
MAKGNGDTLLSLAAKQRHFLLLLSLFAVSPFIPACFNG